MTQAQRVFNHLQQKGTITNAQAHDLYGIRHLPAIIRDVKKKYDIPIYDWWTSGKNRFGEKCQWKIYSIKEKEEKDGETEKGHGERIGEIQSRFGLSA
jgi:hypothetical protein